MRLAPEFVLVADSLMDAFSDTSDLWLLARRLDRRIVFDFEAP